MQMSFRNSDLSSKRHGLTHVLAQAMQRLIDPHLQLGVGPYIDNGFYHDFLLSDGVECGEKDLKDLSKAMVEICKEKQNHYVVVVPIERALEIQDTIEQPKTKELLQSLIDQGVQNVSYYINTIPKQLAERRVAGKYEGYYGKYVKISPYIKEVCSDIPEDQFVSFVNMCKGPHVENWGDLPFTSFKLEKIAGAYRRGSEKNDMMTRVYGVAFETKQELKDYQAMMEEAKKRDHRVLGQKLKLFTLSPLIGSGMPLMQPNGMIIRSEVVDYLRELHKKKGYQRVWTPHLAKEDLYKCSGHADKFGDELFRVQGKEDSFFMKPMNCPHHMMIFADNQFSYRDMPVRYFEPGTVYRDEKTGQLSGLTRVRAITQDDGHLFCRVDQLKKEVGSIVEIIKTFYSTLGMVEDYRVSLSVRGDDGKLYLGSNDIREKAESALQEAADQQELPYKRIEGEAAFYGPKLDFMFKDAIGRERQLATIQCDFNLPERFDLSFVNEEGEKERPVVIHRAISGSLERFMGVMIEHFAGAFPVWLAPKQVRVIPVAESFKDYANTVHQSLLEKGIRSECDDSSDSFSKKIRNGEMRKIPYLLIVGEKEQTNKTVNVRSYKTKEQTEVAAADFIESIVEEYRERSL